ncbi:MAG: response regulator transcription factor [Vicinamibacterales bacterium]
MRLLVVDDDRELCVLLGQLLSREGMDLEYAHSGPAAVERVLASAIDLVVLDVMLPGMDGFDVLRSIRQTSRVPVIMLTARGDDIDRIVGLELGADDYLPKPFNPRELIARIRAVRRRLDRTGDQTDVVSVETVSLDLGARVVSCDGRRVELTSFEFDILEMLMRTAGRILTRDQIMERLYGRAAGPLDRVVDVHISNLRKKLGADAWRIRTVRGAGYQFSRQTAGTEES